MTVHDLTPVQKRAGIYFKRDDLFRPFGEGEVNGGKLRQCMLLVNAVLKCQHDISGIATYSSIHSPQGPIAAATAKILGLPCLVAYGGASPLSIATESMPRLAMSYGACVSVVAKSGRHNVLKSKTEAIVAAKRMFLIEYGINLDDYGDVLLSAVAEQTQNIPDNLNDLYVTCGSGITASGIIIGIEKYRKNVKNIHLISTAFDRRERINSTLRRFGVRRNFIYHDLFHASGFSYNKKQEMRVGGIKLHPQYEAKAMKYIIEHRLSTENALFWVTGAEPKVK